MIRERILQPEKCLTFVESELAAGDDNEAPLATAHGGPALFLISDGAAERRKEAATERERDRLNWIQLEEGKQAKSRSDNIPD